MPEELPLHDRRSQGGLLHDNHSHDGHPSQGMNGPRRSLSQDGDAADNRSPLRPITLLTQAARQLTDGDYAVELPVIQDDELGELSQALIDLAKTLEGRYRELNRIDQITSRINAGLLLDEILENVYQDFRELIPYNRIGFALIDDDGQTVRARWARSDQPRLKLKRGFSAPLAGSSLEQIIDTGAPRILNDLPAYLRQKPESNSTRLIVEEGFQSSLTCPLIANGVPVGFIFFSSVAPHTYDHVHIEIFQRIAAQLSVIVEKGRLVSELAAQKNAIERQNKELLRLNDLKNTFLGIAAHDLRSPLSVIQTAASFLLDPSVEMSDAERATILQEVGEQASYMLGLLDELLDVAQIEAGKLELRAEPIEVSAFLAEAVQRHTRIAAQKSIAIILDSSPPGAARADRFRLRQVIDNLISNAVKFSPAGGVVRVAAKSGEDCWRITVTDQGPGINPLDRDRLFQDFARLSARPTGGERSTGLGLAITRRVVEAHGGQIDVDSRPGEGSTFWFTLPR